MKKAFSFTKLSMALASSALFTLTASNQANACSDPSTEYMGSVCTTAANYCPRGYFVANGALLNISSNSALFSLLGTTYGGDGRSTFALPDMRGRSAIGSGTGPGLSTVKLGQRRGAEREVLTVAQMPNHSHTATFTPSGGGSTVKVEISTETGTLNVPTNDAYLAAGKAGLTNATNYVPDGNQGTTVELGGVSGGGAGGGTVAVGTTGGSQPFNVVSPQLVLTYCINSIGLYPPRN